MYDLTAIAVPIVAWLICLMLLRLPEDAPHSTTWVLGCYFMSLMGVVVTTIVLLTSPDLDADLLFLIISTVGGLLSVSVIKHIEAAYYRHMWAPTLGAARDPLGTTVGNVGYCMGILGYCGFMAMGITVILTIGLHCYWY